MSWIQCVLLSRPRRQDGSWQRSRLRQGSRSRPSRSSRSLCARKGGNKHIRLTCKQCGTVIQGKPEEPTVRSPETCPHENTDARAVRRPLIEFTARTAVSTFMSVPSRSGDSSRTKHGAICSGVAQRGSTFHVVVNESRPTTTPSRSHRPHPGNGGGWKDISLSNVRELDYHVRSVRDCQHDISPNTPGKPPHDRRRGEQIDSERIPSADRVCKATSAHVQER